MFEDYLRTGDTGFLTPAVLPVLNGRKLNTKQHALLETYIGQSRKAIALPFINDEAILEGFDTTYSQMTDEEKKVALQYMYELGRRNGLEKFYQDFPEFMPKDKTDEEEDLQEKMKEFRKSIKD